MDKKMTGRTTDAKDDGTEIRKINKDEAAFIVGPQGKTKNKLSNASGAQIDLVDQKGQSHLEVRGGPQERWRALKYIDYVISQRSGPVKIDESQHAEDLTILLVPADTVSFIIGKGGAHLRMVEEEWWTLLFFLQVNPKNPPANVDPNALYKLAIFGSPRSRRGAELKVMAAVENKVPGYFTKNATTMESRAEGFDTDTILIGEDDYKYALGKGGNTRKKVARASGCIVEYIGRVAYFSGAKRERVRAREYLQWWLQQCNGESAAVEHRGRDDVTIIMVPKHCVGFLTGRTGNALRQIEDETNTFCFVEGVSADGVDETQRPVLILGRQEDRRLAENIIMDRLSQKLDDASMMGDGGYGDSRWGGTWRPTGQFAKGKGGRGKDRWHKGGGYGSYGGKGDYYGLGRSMDYGGNSMLPEPPLERPVGKDTTSEFLSVTEEDAAFLMGQGGRTKKKICAVSGAFLELKTSKASGESTLEIAGTQEQRDKARKYVDIVMRQRLGPVRIDDAEQHDDLTIIEVPQEAVSFVTGHKGSFLRMVEEEFGTLLFFINFSKTNREGKDQLEKLAIFGSERERRGAELKVMAAIEIKQDGYFTSRDEQLPLIDTAEGFATDRMPISEEDYSYALGKGGSTRKKIARASGCIIEYIGRHAYLSGTKEERNRAQVYLHWLFQQRVGPVEVDYAARTDVTVLHVPKDCVGFVTGHKGTSLRAVEESTGTFCFIEGGRDDPNRDPKPLLIFGTAEAREAAEKRLLERIEQKLETGWVYEDYGGGGSGGYHQESGKGDKGKSRDGMRRPGRNGKGGGPPDYRAVPQTENMPAGASPSTPAGKAEQSDQEDDAAWGDWGGFSDDEGANPQSTPCTSGVNLTGALHDSTPVKQTPHGQPPGSATSASARQKELFAEHAKAVEEPDLPPQLLHEEAWPELGGMGASSGGPKKGKRR